MTIELFFFKSWVFLEAYKALCDNICLLSSLHAMQFQRKQELDSKGW